MSQAHIHDMFVKRLKKDFAAIEQKYTQTGVLKNKDYKVVFLHYMFERQEQAEKRLNQHDERMTQHEKRMDESDRRFGELKSELLEIINVNMRWSIGLIARSTEQS